MIHKITKEMEVHIENNLKRKKMNNKIKKLVQKDFSSMEEIKNGLIMRCQSSTEWTHKLQMNKFLKNKVVGSVIN